MRIAFLLSDTLLGGTESASLRLMRQLRDRGHVLTVVSLRPAGPLKPILERDGIDCVDLPPAGKGGWQNLLRLARTLRAARLDAVIHTNHNPVGTLAAAIARIPGRIQVIHHHHIDVKPTWEWRVIYALSRLFQHHIVFVSRFVRDEAVALFPPLASRSSVIHNISPSTRTISTDDKLRSRRALELPSGDIQVIGNAGRHVPVKRFDVFLDVAAKVAARDPSAHFLLAGGGPLTESLKAQAAKLGIADRVHWQSWLSSMDDFYASLDVLLFNSDIDALGLMPVEAMACGIPVVMSVLAGGLYDVIDSGAQGFLLRTHDVERLAECVGVCLGEQGASIGAAGRIASQRYGAPAEVTDRFEQLLASARRR